MKSKVLLLILFLFGFFNCKKIFCPDYGFPEKREINLSDKLRLNGYYYNNVDSPVLWFVFLYKNGIYREGFSDDSFKVRSGRIILSEEDLKADEKLDKTNFGIYFIENDSIVIYLWDYFYFNCPQSMLKFVGFIPNDSTFIIKKYYQINMKNRVLHSKDVNYTYKFVKYSPKPDSVISFIP